MRSSLHYAMDRRKIYDRNSLLHAHTFPNLNLKKKNLEINNKFKINSTINVRNYRTKVDNSLRLSVAMLRGRITMLNMRNVRNRIHPFLNLFSKPFDTQTIARSAYRSLWFSSATRASPLVRTVRPSHCTVRPFEGAPSPSPPPPPPGPSSSTMHCTNDRCNRE
ncbi:hypothetical protein PUN28_008422 [Cardiocondyla obscurior]|uniref:Uncharacterized protein n=1 Tax=Cardiocondyla obscurior TaxID=286306 RepID=A0AAW2FZR3_9HYME